MDQIKVFEHAIFGTVRMLNIDGEPWFVGKDVASTLGYSNPQKAIRDHVDETDWTVNEMFTVNGTKGILINESGLYSLIILSKLPTAKAFKRWVTAEILPSIRKHGAYMTEQTVEKALTDPDFLIRLATELKQEQEKRKSLETQIQENKPKVLFADSVTTSNTCILVGELAKSLKGNGVNIGQNRLFEWLRENGYLVNRKGTDYNTPTQKSMDLGLFKIKETTVICSNGHIQISKTPKITGKGQIYFTNKFLKG